MPAQARHTETMLVDWDLARSTATRLIKPGPTVSRTHARESVTDLLAAAKAAETHVVRYTGLIPVEPIPAVVVVDRPTWALSLLGSMEHTMEPLLAKLIAGKGPSGLTGKAGRTVTGLQVGTAVAWMASRVLGQYDPLRPDGEERLLLVAPNVVHVERALDVLPADFRMWVALHEQTHRLQFCAVPWMRSYFTSLIEEFGSTARLDPADLGARLGAAASALTSAVRGHAGPPLIEVLQGPEARATLDKLVAFMSLLEGHADQVMDAIGPEVVPSVGVIRERFEQRRGHAGIIDRVIKSVMGMDAKLAQYRDGGHFVRTVVDTVGVEGFSAVWESPLNLPTREEIAEPKAWMSRVLV